MGWRAVLPSSAELADLITDVTDLLTVLTRLVELEPAQADLLERILAAPLLTMDDLRVADVRWPTAAGDRKPHRGIEAGASEPGQLEF